jgi:hypothetical protein
MMVTMTDLLRAEPELDEVVTQIKQLEEAIK